MPGFARIVLAEEFTFGALEGLDQDSCAVLPPYSEYGPDYLLLRLRSAGLHMVCPPRPWRGGKEASIHKDSASLAH